MSASPDTKALALDNELSAGAKHPGTEGTEKLSSIMNTGNDIGSSINLDTYRKQTEAERRTGENSGWLEWETKHAETLCLDSEIKFKSAAKPMKRPRPVPDTDTPLPDTPVRQAINSTLKKQKTEDEFDFGIDDGALAHTLDIAQKVSEINIVKQEKRELEIVLDQSMSEEKFQANRVMLLQCQVESLNSTIRGLKMAVKNSTKRMPELKTEINNWKKLAQKLQGHVDWLRGQLALAQMG